MAYIITILIVAILWMAISSSSNKEGKDNLSKSSTEAKKRKMSKKGLSGMAVYKKYKLPM